MVILLHSRTSAAFLAADLKQARVDAVTAAANQAFVQRIGNLQVQASGQGGIRTHGTLAGTPVFETGRFNHSRTCPLTARYEGPSHLGTSVPIRTDRVGFEPTKRLPVYTLSRRVPSATRPPIHAARRAGPQGPGRAGRPRKTRGNISAGRPPKRYVCRHERSGCVAESVAGRVDGRGARCAG